MSDGETFCKGSYSLGTACGTCKRCQEYQREALKTHNDLVIEIENFPASKKIEALKKQLVVANNIILLQNNQIEKNEDKVIETIGWTMVECCLLADKGEDVRKVECGHFLERAKEDGVIK